MSFAVELKNVNKSYKLWRNSSSKSQYALFDLLLKTLPKNLYRRIEAVAKSKFYTEFNALVDINLKIPHGSSYGIIGKNGAGKSTLLEIISGTLKPTSGTVNINGKASALLELGSGFNPEFTGRENIYIYGTILGLTKEYVSESFQEIEKFADIGKFIDQPLKTYSSGMKMRLAFSVVSFLKPEILIIDEALAVGDDAFRRKCYAKIDYLLKSGITFILVSHSSSSIIQLCNSAIWLHKGSLVLESDAETVTNRYQQYTSRRNNPSVKQIRQNLESHSSNEVSANSSESKSFYSNEFKPESTVFYTEDGGSISSVKLLDNENRPVSHIVNGGKYTIRYSVKFTRPHKNVFFSFLVKTPIGFPLGGSLSHPSGRSIANVNKNDQFNLSFIFECNLAHSTYFVNVGVKAYDGEKEYFVHRIIDAISFRVLPIPDSTISSFVDFKPEIIVIKK